MQLNMNGINHIPKGTIIYARGKETDSLSIILKGKVLVYNSGIKILLKIGSVMGAGDLCTGNYGINAYALEDTSLFTIAAKNVDELGTVLEEKQKQRGTVVIGMIRYLSEIYKVEMALKKEAGLLYTLSKNLLKELEKLKTQLGEKTEELVELEELAEIQTEDMAEEEEKNYYAESGSVPLSVQEEFYSYSPIICNYHIKELSMLIQNTTELCTELSEYCFKVSELLFSENREDCLYKVVTKLGIYSSKAGIPIQPFFTLLDKISEKLLETERMVQAKTGSKVTSKESAMQQVKNLLKESENATEEKLSAESAVKYATVDMEKMQQEFSGSLEKLLAYAEYEKEPSEEIKKEIEAFLLMKDKSDVSDASRKVRRKITEHFYELYEIIFRKAYQSQSVPKIVDLFLNYGYMDERLLEKEQLLELYYLEDTFPKNGPCAVYTIREWLCRIYEGKEEPSKSEFDLEYAEALRDKKKSGEITEKEMKQMENDRDAKLTYEIKNMFRYNNRLVTGQISTFVPVLYKDLFMGHVEQALVTAQKVNQLIMGITDIDYSVFYREVLYENREKKIERETIMVEVFPNVILLPSYGSNIIMWQEIAGKRRASSGRILLPIFAEGDMEDAMIKAIARFRWELCRTVQGMAWNDIQEKSLTSEYCDYIQFYKKNRNLSEDKKEKLKVQIQKGRGNTREIFVSDYLVWIKNESQGAVRLNKVVREMLATWCPFSQWIRTKVVQQPIFEEAFARYNREKQKKGKELETRYRNIENNNGEIVEELQKTIRYYREL